jgi:hypothetical protein
MARVKANKRNQCVKIGENNGNHGVNNGIISENENENGVSGNIIGGSSGASAASRSLQHR